MTTNASGEPIVGTGAPGNTDPTRDRPNETLPLRQGHQPVVAPLSAYPGQTLSTLQPTNIMYQLTRGADGTVWGGGQWGKTYRSTDGGKTFTAMDEHALLAKTDPAYYTTGYPAVAGGDGAVYGIRVAPNGYVYEGTETAGVIYSPDNGATWHPLDYDYTNPNSTMARDPNVGNVAGLGFTKDGKVVVQPPSCHPAPPPTPPPPLPHRPRPPHPEAAPASRLLLRLQDVHTITTTPDGTLFINTGRNTLASGAPATGGIFTSTDGLNWTMFNTGLTSTDNFDFRLRPRQHRRHRQRHLHHHHRRQHLALRHRRPRTRRRRPPQHRRPPATPPPTTTLAHSAPAWSPPVTVRPSCPRTRQTRGGPALSDPTAVMRIPLIHAPARDVKALPPLPLPQAPPALPCQTRVAACGRGRGEGSSRPPKATTRAYPGRRDGVAPPEPRPPVARRPTIKCNLY